MTAPRSCALLLLVALLAALTSCNAEQNAKDMSFLDFSVEDLRGRQVSMREFNAFPVILVVNVASECGYTDQNYRELQELYDRHHDDGLMILAFPCNQFGRQEPGTPDEILKFTEEKYHVTFPLFTKVDVNGDKTHPLFKFLKIKLDGFVTNDIKWNFTKFLIVNHEPFKRYGTTTSPLDIEKDIVQALQSSQHVDAFDDGGAAGGDYDAHDEL
ncbi:hypothetical protein BBO99_00004676 [Phytophthora kernoviae]|uniref:Glutathione peroxidase n=2 Tax=Phytophthora kernoviae TaxID=325452 RepID=A0A3R7JUE6_9STRA|nr:hypothetical protein G195_006807 [Phytophthora kernoviae 00238/432]KAG2527147.1 hypothetical protein JM18_003978 [Phytophthora kernoviae]KAG2528739.1 hypothetical protein JM16_002528 [Phytophthora kernoviae]RLN37942.1 hypothetical protein BBI17_002913 [Phytophthora kernoviae]RLN80207.1 hypothetical protein BBO99_00004676 [Phytophthora kernoviae]